MARDTYKYHFKRGNKILHTGITNDLDRREGEHQRDIDPKGDLSLCALHCRAPAACAS